MGTEALIERLEKHQCGCGGACGQQTPAYIREAAAALKAAEANVEYLAKDNEEHRQQVIDLQNQIMKERFDLTAARAEIERLNNELKSFKEPK